LAIFSHFSLTLFQSQLNVPPTPREPGVWL
jgi:hypothetical protein